MTVTPEILKKAHELIRIEVSDAILTALLEKLPSEQMMPLTLPMMGEALRDVPAGASTEQAVGIVLRKMQRKSDNKKDDNAGNAKKKTREYFDSIWLEQRLMDAVQPTTEMHLFGEVFKTPIMTAALSHLKAHQPGMDSAMAQYAMAARKAGAVHWVGMCENDEYAEIAAAGAKIIRIIKPYADDAKIFDQIKFAEEHGALAVGMDIDHTFTEDGNIDILFGEKLAIKSSADIQKYIESTNLPFVIKGVLSVHDAVACAKIGAKGIVVSHHGGRMNYAVPPLAILPDIVEAVGNQMAIFVDSGIQSGADAYKALAMGATAVSVGTHLMPLLRAGSDKIAERMNEMNLELRGFMANTGVADVTKFDASILHFMR